MDPDSAIRKRRILVADTSPAVTGALNSILRSSDHLRDLIEFTFLIPNNSVAGPVIERQGFKVIKLPLRELRRTLWSMISYLPVLVVNAFRLKRIIREGRYDIVVVNDFYNLVPSVAVLLGAKIPLVTYVRFIPSRFPPMLVRTWIWAHEKTSACFVAVSGAVRRHLSTTLQVFVVGNEVPPYDAPIYDNRSRIILYPANYVRGKGQDHALQAFAKVASEFPEWTLRFAGGDLGLEKNRQFKTELQSLARKLGIFSRTEWLDFQAEMSAHYASAGLVLVFSDSESFSMVCLEAMHCSRPLIATRCGGPDEIIDDQQDGLLVPVKDIKAMASAMRLLMGNVALRETFSKAAGKKVDERFSIDLTTEKLSGIYNEVLK